MLISFPRVPVMRLALFLLLVLAMWAPIVAQAQDRLFAPIGQSSASAAKATDGVTLTPRQDYVLTALRDAQGAAAELQLVTADADLLTRAETLRLVLPGGADVTLTTDARTVNANGTLSWRGRAGEGLRAPVAALVVSGSDVVGTIWVEGHLYSVTPLTEGLHALIRADDTQTPDLLDDAVHAPHGAHGDAAPPHSAHDHAEKRASGASAITAADVLIAYTADVAAVQANPTAYAQSLIDAVNVMLANSATDLRYALAHAYQTPTATSGEAGEDLGDFIGQGDGRFDEVHALRNTHNADLVTLLGTSLGVGGIARLNARAEAAFNLVTANATDTPYILGHELGHNMGARHSPEDDSATEPYPYGHGIVVGSTGGEDSWRSVMAVGFCPEGPCDWLPYFSNPDVTVRGSAAGDVTLRDNARVFDERAATVANFRTSGTTRIYVDASAGGANNGTTWANAFTNLQDAIAQSSFGDEIWVANGTYYPDEGAGQTNGDRTASFWIKDGVKHYGGFAGGETSINQRDIAANPAILSGDLSQNDGADFANNGENAYQVVDASGTTATTLLDGFTITGGNANGPDDSFDGNPFDGFSRGGGMYMFNAAPSITRTTITKNNAALLGGGVYAVYGGPILMESVVSDNTSGDEGGGFYLWFTQSTMISKSTFSGNTAADEGGGIRIFDCQGDDSCLTTITETTVSNNRAAFGGGISSGSSETRIAKSTIAGNSATQRGGGVVLFRNQGAITSSTITGNTSAIIGGGVRLIDGMFTVTASTIAGNSTGAVGGGVYSENGAQVTISSSIVWGNSDRDGDGAAAQVNTVTGGTATVNYSVLQNGVASGVTDGGNNKTGDPFLSTLADNGGSTFTMLPLLESSSALEAGLCGSLTTDQRGRTRPYDISSVADITDACDAGAVERQADDPTTSLSEVTTVTDEQDGSCLDGDCSLRDALALIPDGGTITFAAALSGQTLPISIRPAFATHFVITGKTVTIDASNLADGVVLQSNGDGRLFTVFTDGSLTLRGLTLTGGRASFGGALDVQGNTTTLDRVTITGNAATSSSGGGVSVRFNASLIMTNTTITGNTAVTQGGGLWLQRSEGMIAATGSTIYGNDAPTGEQLRIDAGTVTLTSSVLGGGSDPGADCSRGSGTLTASHTLVEDGSCITPGTNDNRSGDAMLGALADNGGPTQTLLPQLFSPVVDAGICAALTIDQRGLGRPYDDGSSVNVGDACDIGAVEAQANEVFQPDCDDQCYVNVAATGANDGTSWTNAFTSLQVALRGADSGDEIWVAAGTYYPDAGLGQADGNRSASFQLKTGVTLYGGFAGSETSLGQRSIADNPTILSGDLDQNDGADFANNSENAYHVVTATGPDATAVLDGFTITAGNADGSGDDRRGGGIYVISGSPTLRQNTITGNSAEFGGGILSAGSPVISASTITGNRATVSGGGLSTRTANATLSGSTITGNTAAGNGGGVYTTSGVLTITSTTIASNTAVGSGGGIANSFTSPVITSTILWGNSASSGTDAAAQITNGSSTPTVSYSIVQGGLSSGTTDGGNNLTSDPLLGALADNSGPTRTMQPASTSPVRDAGSCAGQTSDQRGKTRPTDLDGIANTDDGCDIGAVELTIFEAFGIVCSGTCYVDVDATGDGTGTSWADAIPVLQDALGAVESSDAIWVAEGTYYPDQGVAQTDGARGSTFNLVDGVAVYGGFAGTETALAQRDIAGNPTILSGDLSQNDGANFANNTENAYHVVTASSASANTILDGFTIVGGNASGGGSAARGGGLYVSGGAPVLRALTVADNAASSQGGGLYMLSSLATLSANLFTRNAAQDGGGLYTFSGGYTLTTSTFVGNTASDEGGAIYNRSNSPTLHAVTLVSNTAGRTVGGGIYNEDSGGNYTGVILWANEDGGGNTDDTAQLYKSSSVRSLTVGSSIVQGGLSSRVGDGGNNRFADPLLGALQNNGGPTLTMLPGFGSPAVDAGSCAGITTDQRGQPRPVDAPDVTNVGDGCDIGAVEAQLGAELPVELTAFEAVVDQRAVVLTWQTATETNNAGFHVELRPIVSEANGQPDVTPWRDVQFVQGHGTTLEAQRYQARLDDLTAGSYRVRLRQVDFDGTFDYSPEIEVTLEMAESFVLSPAYPNPFNPSAQFTLQVREAQQAEIMVYDASGRQVAQVFSGRLSSGTAHVFRLEASGWASGLYVIRVRGERFMSHQSVMLLK
ncbi:MAG: hypothetical protein RhofKO_14120 [Rhodothermales bacterium]